MNLFYCDCYQDSYILCDSYSLYTKRVKWRNWFSIPSKLCTNSMGSGLSERKFQFPIALMFTYFHFDYESYKFKAFWYNVFIIRIYSYKICNADIHICCLTLLSTTVYNKISGSEIVSVKNEAIKLYWHVEIPIAVKITTWTVQGNKTYLVFQFCSITVYFKLEILKTL